MINLILLTDINCVIVIAHLKSKPPQSTDNLLADTLANIKIKMEAALVVPKNRNKLFLIVKKNPEII